MASVIPLVRNTACCLYPVRRVVQFATEAAVAANSSEIRSRTRPPLTRLNLTYNTLSYTDMNTLVAFIDDQTGPASAPIRYTSASAQDGFIVIVGRQVTNTTVSGTNVHSNDGPFRPSDVGLSVALVDVSGGHFLGKVTSYSSATDLTIDRTASASGDIRVGYYVDNLVFDGSQIQAMETHPNLYSVTIECHQTRNTLFTAGDSGGQFPSLASGAPMQRPFTRGHRYPTMLNDCPNGQRFAFAFFSNPLLTDVFPFNPLRVWNLQYPNLSDTDVNTLESFFNNQFGSYGTFSFFDPDTSIQYDNCRFMNDTLEVTHTGPEENSVLLQIGEFKA